MAETLIVGQPAPAFAFTAADGAPLTNATCHGRKVVLYFYPKDDTSGCTREAIDFNRLRADFLSCDTTIIGISPDSAKSHEKFKTKHGLDIDLGSDESTELLQAFGVCAQKSMYGRKYMGVERTTVLVGRDGAVAKLWSNVKVPGHAEEVLAAARALA